VRQARGASPRAKNSRVVFPGSIGLQASGERLALNLEKNDNEKKRSVRRLQGFS